MIPAQGWLSEEKGEAEGDPGWLPLPGLLRHRLLADLTQGSAAADWQVGRYELTGDLDVERTVSATVREGGALVPIHQRRRFSDESLFLIERQGPFDHMAALFELVVRRLRDEGVHLERFFYRDDPRFLTSPERGETLRLNDVLNRYQDCRLVVVATADGFFHPLTGEPEIWLGDIGNLVPRVLLNTRPLDEWGWREMALFESGFSLTIADTDGLERAGKKLGRQHDQTPTFLGMAPAEEDKKESSEQSIHRNTAALKRGDTSFDVSYVPTMVMISTGFFKMGSSRRKSQGQFHECPRHRVVFKRRFTIGRCPVTFRQYDHYCDVTGRQKPDDEGWGRDQRPVINVSWLDARDYAYWLSRLTGKHYRLPSEAEWEYACRAGTKTPYAFGDAITGEQANFGGNVNQTTEVGAYLSNAWGLNDMHGNVWEWVADGWHKSYLGAPKDGTAWIDDGEISTVVRVVRGGSWYDSSDAVRSASRGGFDVTQASNCVGFRLASELGR